MLLHATGGAEPDTPHADPPAPGRDFGRIAAFAARLLDTPLSVLSLVEEERPYTCGAPGDAWQRRLAAPLSRTLCGVAVRTGSVVLAEDARDLPAVLADPEMWLGEVGYAGIPFHHADGRVAGALSVADQRRRAWTPEEVELLASLAHFAALLVRSEDRGRTLDGVLAAAAGSAGRGVSLRMLRKAVETMQLGVTITDLSGRILYSNPADARMHGYEAGELEGADARILAPPEQARPLQPQRLEEVRSWSRETVNVRKDGTRFPVLLRSDLVTDPAGRPVALVTCCEDLTHRKALEQELLRNAFYDPVTRLPNSGLLRHRLDLTMDAARREERRFAVVGIELDRVQLVRDSLGREAGEDLLRAAGERLRECSPPEAMLAHVAQDQFVVLVEPPQALDAATRVAACVRGDAARALPGRGARRVHRGERGRRALRPGVHPRRRRPPRRGDRGGPRPRGGGRAVPGLRPRHARGGHGPAGPGERPPPGAGAGRAAGPLPADRAAGHRQHHRLRGPRAVGAPGARAPPPRRVRAAGGGDRAHPPHRPGGAGGGLPHPGRLAAAPRVRGSQDGGQPFPATVRAAGPGAAGAGRARPHRRHAGDAGAGDHRERHPPALPAGDAGAPPAQGAGGGAARGRLRDRLLLPGLSAPPSPRRAEDRPLLHLGERAQRPPDRAHHRGHGAGARGGGDRRGDRDAPSSWASCGGSRASTGRGTSSPARRPPRRSKPSSGTILPGEAAGAQGPLGAGDGCLGGHRGRVRAAARRPRRERRALCPLRATRCGRWPRAWRPSTAWRPPW
jgi:PAS domain S-box-containing protein